MHLEAITEGPMSQTLAIARQVQRLKIKPGTQKAMDPDTFTQFLQENQPDTNTSPLPISFTPPRDFETYVQSAITTMDPN